MQNLSISRKRLASKRGNENIINTLTRITFQVPNPPFTSQIPNLFRQIAKKLRRFHRESIVGGLMLFISEKFWPRRFGGGRPRQNKPCRCQIALRLGRRQGRDDRFDQPPQRAGSHPARREVCVCINRFRPPLRIMVAGLRVSSDSADHMPDHDDLQPVHAKMRGLAYRPEDGFRTVRQCSGPKTRRVAPWAPAAVVRP